MPHAPAHTGGNVTPVSLFRKSRKKKKKAQPPNLLAPHRSRKTGTFHKHTALSWMLLWCCTSPPQNVADEQSWRPRTSHLLDWLDQGCPGLVLDTPPDRISKWFYWLYNRLPGRAGSQKCRDWGHHSLWITFTIFGSTGWFTVRTTKDVRQLWLLMKTMTAALTRGEDEAASAELLLHHVEGCSRSGPKKRLQSVWLLANCACTSSHCQGTDIPACVNFPAARQLQLHLNRYSGWVKTQRWRMSGESYGEVLFSPARRLSCRLFTR